MSTHRSHALTTGLSLYLFNIFCFLQLGFTCPFGDRNFFCFPPKFGVCTAVCFPSIFEFVPFCVSPDLILWGVVTFLCALDVWEC